MNVHERLLLTLLYNCDPWENPADVIFSSIYLL